MLQALNKNKEENTQKPPPEIFLPNDQKNVKSKDKKAQTQSKKQPA